MGGPEDILGDGRLLKTIEVEGDGPCPRNGQRVEVHYETRLAAGGAKIDSTWDLNEAFDFVLGEDQVLEAWDLGVTTMRPGERSVFTVDPSLAYGEDGAGDDIPGSATLEFTIELLTGKKPSAPSKATGPAEQKASKLSEKQGAIARSESLRLQRAEEAKARGNDLVRRGDFRSAQEAYREALSLLQGNSLSATAKKDGTAAEEERNSLAELGVIRESKQLRLSCLLNLSQCDLKLDDHAAAVRDATEALELDPDSCKALYRRGVAQLASGDFTSAKADLLKALQLDPRNTEIRSRLEECRGKMAEYAQWHKSVFGGMFGKAPELKVRQRNLDDLPKAWLNIQIGSGPIQRIVVALYNDTVPRTAENFRCLCTGERGVGKCGQPLQYRRTLVHKVVARGLIEAGDIEKYDGTGGESIYGQTFADENFEDTHHRRGLLSMANTGPDTNNSKFFFTLRSLPELDGRHAVFGEVVAGMNVLDDIESVETEYPDWPVVQIAVVSSGEGTG